MNQLLRKSKRRPFVRRHQVWMVIWIWTIQMISQRHSPRKCRGHLLSVLSNSKTSMLERMISMWTQSLGRLSIAWMSTWPSHHAVSAVTAFRFVDATLKDQALCLSTGVSCKTCRSLLSSLKLSRLQMTMMMTISTACLRKNEIDTNLERNERGGVEYSNNALFRNSSPGRGYKKLILLLL